LATFRPDRPTLSGSGDRSMSDTSDTPPSRLDRAKRRQLRELGWRWLGRKRAKRPRSVDRRHLVEAAVDDDAALVDLDARL
jgi:hypothetical protein